MTHRTSFPRRLRRFLREEDGTQLVEFAILLPLMLLLFAVVVDGGRALWSYQATGAAVRDAARYLARVVPSDVCASGGSLSGYASTVGAIVRENASGDTLFPSPVTVTSVTPALTCVEGGYRVGVVGIASVTAELEVSFPLEGVFAMFGIDRPALTARISDQSRVFGT